MSHELLADMLGGTRATVSSQPAVSRAKRPHSIQPRRHPNPRRNEGLEKTACECYQIIKHHLKNYAEFDTPITGE
jgi:hypothetical protein